MIARKLATEQILRLKSLPKFPEDQESIDTLVDMLETAPSTGAARTFVTCWLQDEFQAPTPAHVYRYFHPTKSTEQLTTTPPASSKNCPFCNGSGWSVITRQDGSTAATPCRCRKQIGLFEAEKIV